MNVLFAKCIECTENFLDALDTLLMGLLFLRFEHKLKRLAQKREKKYAEVLKTQKEYEDVQKRYNSVFNTYETIQRHGI